ncbi:hypothetical protein [Streptomyces gardneri]|uniref:hypothetical protein n=1 Tax=Streptomyces gardneri TaxID=66892 RepID=UPI00367C3284
MSDWGIALIAAGSAIAGSIAAGYFAWKAGHRQAAAAEAAGQAQADALISSVQDTLGEQRHVRAEERRRRIYLEVLLRLRDYQLDCSAENAARALKACEELSLEDSEYEYVYTAAVQYAQAAIGSRVESAGQQEIHQARQAYLAAVRRALNETQ